MFKFFKKKEPTQSERMIQEERDRIKELEQMLIDKPWEEGREWNLELELQMETQIQWLIGRCYETIALIKSIDAKWRDN